MRGKRAASSDRSGPRDWTHSVSAVVVLGSPFFAMAIFFGVAAVCGYFDTQLGPFRTTIVQSVAIGNAILSGLASGVGGWFHDRPFGWIGNTLCGVMYGQLGYLALFTLSVTAAD